MKPILSERNIVIFLFVSVLVIFAMAQEDSRKMQVIQVAVTATKPKQLMAEHTTTLPRNAAKEIKTVKVR
jgi:hypothetical protein